MEYDQMVEDFNAWVARNDRFDGFDRGDDGRIITEDEYDHPADAEHYDEWIDIDF